MCVCVCVLCVCVCVWCGVRMSEQQMYLNASIYMNVLRETRFDDCTSKYFKPDFHASMHVCE